MADFLGTEVGIANIQITGSTVTFTAVFKDGVGKVHGHINHSMDVGERKELHSAAAKLLQVLEGIARRTHYTGLREERAHGIAEALREAARDTERADEDGI